MNLRPLTTEEKATIREAKKVANNRIKRRRLLLRLDEKYAHSVDRRIEAEQELPKMTLLTGYPVRVSAPLGRHVLLDYEDLRTFVRSLKNYSVRYWFDPERTERGSV